MLGRTLLGLLETQAHAGRRAALGTIRRTATWAEHRHQCLICLTGHGALRTGDALDALGSLWTCGGLVVRAHPWGLGPTRRWRPPVSSRRSTSEWTMAFAGLWRVHESP
jgi:hypothetical protein